MTSFAQKEKQKRDLLKALGKPEDAKLCALSELILNQYAYNRERVGEWTETLKSSIRHIPHYGVSFFTNHAKAADIREAFELFAVGAHICSEAVGEQNFNRLQIGSLDGNQARAWVNSSKNLLVIGTNFFYEYVGMKYAHLATNQEFRDGHLPHQDKLLYLHIHTGVEEYYHIYQDVNPQKRAQLEDQLIERYGPNWRQERAEQQSLATNIGQLALKRFYAEDPIEKDAAEFIKTIEPKIQAAAEAFKAKQTGIG